MIKAKKNKLLKTLLILSGTITSIAAVSSATFFALRKSGFGEKTNVTVRSNIEPSISKKIKIIIDPNGISINDMNVKTKDEKITTTFNFIYNNQTIKSEQVITDINEKLEFDINSKIPTGYVLDDAKNPLDQIIVKPGSDVIIYIKPLSETKTIVQFFDGDEQVGEPLTFSLDEDIKADTLKSKLPQGYELADLENLRIVVGVVNRIQIQKIVEKREIKIYFKNGDETIDVIKIEATDGMKINPMDYLPNGFKFVLVKPEDGSQPKAPEITIDFNTQPFKTEYDFAITSIEKKVTTTFRFVLESDEKTIVSTIEVGTEEGQKIDLTRITSKKPEDYEISKGWLDKFDENDFIKVGQVNDVPVIKIIKRLKTIINYKEASGELKSQKVLQLPENETVQASQYIPFGYELANGDKSISAGENVSIIIKPIINEKVTTIEFTYNNETIKTAKLSGDNVDVASLLGELPPGYELKNSSQKINVGEVNKVELIKVLHTSIEFKTRNGQFIDKQDFSTNETEKINYTLPPGYQLDYPDGQIPRINKGSLNNIIYVKKIIIQKIYNIVWIDKTTNKPVGSGTQIITPENQIPDLVPHVPNSYKLVNRLEAFNLKTSITNRVEVLKIIVKHSTKLIFKTASGETFNKTVETTDNQPIDVSKWVPDGYRLVNSSDTSYKLDENNEYAIEKIPVIAPPKPVPVVPEPEPVQPTKPKDEVERKLSTSEIANIIASGGARLNARSITVSKESTLPSVPTPNFSEEEKARYRTFGSDLSKLVNNISKEVTFQDLKKFVSPTYNNDDYLKGIADYLNGKEWAGNKPPANIRQLWKEWISVALRSLESELAKGKIPRLEIGSFPPSLNYSPIDDDHNAVVVRNKNDNKKRTFKTNSKWNRQGGSLVDGEYFGWTKWSIDGEFDDLITPTESRNETTIDKETGRRVSLDDGVRIFEYTPETSNTEVDPNKKIYLIRVDVTNKLGIQHYKDVMNSEKGKKITAVYFENIGKEDPNQDMSDLYRSLPTRVKKLTLFYLTQRMYGIRELRNKNLDDVEIFTQTPLKNIDDNIGDDLLSRGAGYGWGIDANAFKNTKYISYDPGNNSGFSDAPGGRYTASVQFNVIRPDRNSSLSDVINCFKLILHTHKDWRVYNGAFGDEGWPVKIDLSLTNLNSLKGINIYNLKFKTIKFHSATDVFTVAAADLGKAQYSAVLADWGPSIKPKILFDNPTTKTIHISGNAIDLKGTKFIPELQALTTASVDGAKVTKLLVDNQDMLDLLRRSGAVDSRISISIKTNNSDNGGSIDFD